MWTAGWGFVATAVVLLCASWAVEDGTPGRARLGMRLGQGAHVACVVAGVLFAWAIARRWLQ